MTLILHSTGAYACYPNSKTTWRRDDYDVNKFVKALKGETVKGHATLKGADSALRVIDEAHKERAFGHFHAWGAQRWRSLGAAQASVVPLPSSSCTDFAAVTTPTRLAAGLVTLSGGTLLLARWLRFSRPMPKSHQGGGRSESVLRAAMELSPALRPSNVILVDDVKTTGAHLRAAASLLREAGCTVNVAFCAATSVWSQVAKPWELAPEDLEADLSEEFDF